MKHCLPDPESGVVTRQCSSGRLQFHYICRATEAKQAEFFKPVHTLSICLDDIVSTSVLIFNQALIDKKLPKTV